MLTRWNPNLFDYSPIFIITSSIPLLIQYKINLIITIAIAIDRLQVCSLRVWKEASNQEKICIFFKVVCIWDSNKTFVF